MEEKRPKLGSAVLVEHNRKFLLGLRNKENYNNYWVIPGGGVRWGETLEQAAIREIKEETNLDIEIIRMIGWKEILNTEENYHTVVFFHLARPKNLDISAGEDISDARFFSVEEIKKIKAAESVEWAIRQAGFWR